MADYTRARGSTSNLFRRTLKNSSTGAGFSGLTGASSGLVIGVARELQNPPATIYTAAASSIQTIANPGTWVAPSASDCRLGAYDATNEVGEYELQFADALFGVADASRFLRVTIQGVTNLLIDSFTVELTQWDLQANAPANVLQWLNTAALLDASNTYPLGVVQGFTANGVAALKAALLGGSVVTGPVVQGGAITLYRGTDYNSTYSNNAQFTIGATPVLTSATLELWDVISGASLSTGSFTTVGGTQVIDFNIAATALAGASFGPRPYLVVANYGTGASIALVAGTIYLAQGIS